MHFIFLLLLVLTRPLIITHQTGESTRERAPNFSLKNTSNQAVRLSDFKGKVVLINFWATWCAPCMAEMPQLAKWQKQHQARGLQIVGITYAPHQPIKVRQIVRKLKLNYPVLLGTLDTAQAYKVGEVE